MIQKARRADSVLHTGKVLDLFPSGTYRDPFGQLEREIKELIIRNDLTQDEKVDEMATKLSSTTLFVDKVLKSWTNQLRSSKVATMVTMVLCKSGLGNAKSLDIIECKSDAVVVLRRANPHVHKLDLALQFVQQLLVSKGMTVSSSLQTPRLLCVVVCR
jgi:hypothetical protein